MVGISGLWRIVGYLILLHTKLSLLKVCFRWSLKVCDFIDVEKRCWDSDLLNQAFLPFEVEEIARIPLSVRLPKDK